MKTQPVVIPKKTKLIWVTIIIPLPEEQWKLYRRRDVALH